jgi:ABC-type glycerol-3-phosphate transport system permease component
MGVISTPAEIVMAVAKRYLMPIRIVMAVVRRYIGGGMIMGFARRRE